MPAGVPVGEYLKFTLAAFLSMALGAQTVHMFYRPMEDLDAYISNEMGKLPSEIQEELASTIKAPKLTDRH